MLVCFWVVWISLGCGFVACVCFAGRFGCGGAWYLGQVGYLVCSFDSWFLGFLICDFCGFVVVIVVWWLISGFELMVVGGYIVWLLFVSGWVDVLGLLDSCFCVLVGLWYLYCGFWILLCVWLVGGV